MMREAKAKLDALLAKLPASYFDPLLPRDFLDEQRLSGA